MHRSSDVSFLNIQREKRRRRIVSVCILALVIIIAAAAVVLFSHIGGTKEIISRSLPCQASQQPTAFGGNLLYYDDVSIHCIGPTGASKWTFTIGSGASFTASDDYVAAWIGSQLYIVDSRGNPTYNESMPSDIQFVRIGKKYCAVVCGDDTAPDLIVKDINGIQVDEEIDAFSGLMLLDAGFYGDGDQYLWVLSIDIYGTAINTKLNTFQVGKLNTGEVSLGETLAYKVLFEDSKLRVFTTQKLYTYDYKAVEDTTSSLLVYGWRLIDSDIPARGSGQMLLAPTSQMGANQSIYDLRLLNGNQDKRYVLPSECVGVGVRNGKIYGVSSQNLYVASVNEQRFTSFPLNLPQGAVPTGFVGLLDSGYVAITCSDKVYSVSLPK